MYQTFTSDISIESNNQFKVSTHKPNCRFTNKYDPKVPDENLCDCTKKERLFYFNNAYSIFSKSVSDDMVERMRNEINVMTTE